jgi:uncharacterized membrane protein
VAREWAEAAVGVQVGVTTETRRRTLVKTILWRLIGIAWTWIGAYLILRLTPERYRSAAAVATFIVLFHHSTRMVMYYAHERVWAGIRWGKFESDSPNVPAGEQEKHT